MTFVGFFLNEDTPWEQTFSCYTTEQMCIESFLKTNIGKS